MSMKATCPGCNELRAVRTDGTMRKHACVTAEQESTILIPLPWAAPPLSPNQRQHWATKARATGLARTEARWVIRAAKVRPIVGADITLHWRVPDRRRRDADNLAATKKAVTDALVDEGVLQDDSWVCVPSSTERIHPPEPGMPAALWLELTNVVEYEPDVRPGGAA